MLILGKDEKDLQIYSKVYDLIFELNHICPTVLVSVLPQLECKLKSLLENERLGAVTLLARMFSEKESELAKQHSALWRAFLGRFNDISVTIRTKCVQYSMHFLLNHPDLRKDITETLKMRQHDSEENVRLVTFIISTVKFAPFPHKLLIKIRVGKTDIYFVGKTCFKALTLMKYFKYIVFHSSNVGFT